MNLGRGERDSIRVAKCNFRGLLLPPHCTNVERRKGVPGAVIRWNDDSYRSLDLISAGNTPAPLLYFYLLHNDYDFSLKYFEIVLGSGCY